MNEIDIKSLQIGDIIRNEGSGLTYVIIHAAPKEFPVAIRTLTVTQPSEWTLIAKCNIV